MTFRGNRKLTGRDAGITTVRRMDFPGPNSEFHERLAWARLYRAKLKKMTQAATLVGAKPGTYRTWERDKADGGRKPSIEEVKLIARRMGVSWLWLMHGDGAPDDADANELYAIAAQLAEGFGRVPEEKRADAMRAVEGVLGAFAVKQAS